MDISKLKAIDFTALTALIVVFITGIILFLRKFGVTVEPRSVIKVIHWCAGYIFFIMAVWHFSLHKKWLAMIHTKQPHYWMLLVSLPVIVFLVFATGTVKLLFHGIHGLGMWHFWLGIIMVVALGTHISKAIRFLIRAMHKPA